MKRDSNLKLRCYLLSLLYSVSFMYYNSIPSKKCHCKVEDNYSNSVIYDISNKIGDEIFIGTDAEVENEYNNPNSSYLAYIVDERNYLDPNYRIYNSYLIRDRKVMYEILKSLVDYESLNPSRWDRTIESMMKEWNIHNICYDLNIDRERTSSVDFNNDDEKDYNNNRYFRLMLKNDKK